MSLRVQSYLRTERRKWALTQKELTFLLGRKSPTHISRLEQGKRLPSADAILACEILFGVAPRTLFPKLYADTEENVMERAAILYEQLEQEGSLPAQRKKEFLSVALKRAITRLNQPEEL